MTKPDKFNVARTYMEISRQWRFALRQQAFGPRLIIIEEEIIVPVLPRIVPEPRSREDAILLQIDKFFFRQIIVFRFLDLQIAVTGGQRASAHIPTDGRKHQTGQQAAQRLHGATFLPSSASISH